MLLDISRFHITGWYMKQSNMVHITWIMHLAAALNRDEFNRGKKIPKLFITFCVAIPRVASRQLLDNLTFSLSSPLCSNIWKVGFSRGSLRRRICIIQNKQSLCWLVDFPKGGVTASVSLSPHLFSPSDLTHLWSTGSMSSMPFIITHSFVPSCSLC